MWLNFAGNTLQAVKVIKVDEVFCVHVYVIAQSVKKLVKLRYVIVAPPKVFFLNKKQGVVKCKKILVSFGHGAVGFNVRGSRIGIAFYFKQLQVVNAGVKACLRRPSQFGRQQEFSFFSGFVYYFLYKWFMRYGSICGKIKCFGRDMQR